MGVSIYLGECCRAPNAAHAREHVDHYTLSDQRSMASEKAKGRRLALRRSAESRSRKPPTNSGSFDGGES